MIHQKYAVLDGKTVWYGSINLLSFGTSQETMMRLQNREIRKHFWQKLITWQIQNSIKIFSIRQRQSSAQDYVILLCFFLYLYVKIFTAINKENEQYIKALYPH